MSKILVIEDDAAIRENVLDLLEAEGLEGIGAKDGALGVELAFEHRPGLILCDVMMPGLDGYGVLERLGSQPETSSIPFIFLSARAERADVRRGMTLGADDYLTKPFTRLELLEAIRARLARHRTRANVPPAAEGLDVRSVELAEQPVSVSPPPGVVLQDARMQALFEQIARVAKRSISVLILGETGVGKELVAEAVHRASGRSGPFLALNCAALPESLLEAELFGHEKGAFTGALQARAGLFEAAHGGTLFLDEVGELPASVQVKLLRVLETRSVLRIGSRAPRPIDVRFVSATHRAIDREPNVGPAPFRRDLYFRLSGITLQVPALRERRADLLPLIRHFIMLSLKDQPQRQLPGISPTAVARLEAHDWPGNIRELRNVIERAVALSDGGEIDLEHLSLPTSGVEDPAPPSQEMAAPSPRARLLKELEQFERDRIVDALARCAGNQTSAAELLGISRRTLVTRLREFDLPRPRRRAGS
ncbi:MAG: sigma-54 dependent transcriptional regulator [Myxococcales bacterium]